MTDQQDASSARVRFGGTVKAPVDTERVACEGAVQEGVMNRLPLDARGDTGNSEKEVMTGVYAGDQGEAGKRANRAVLRRAASINGSPSPLQGNRQPSPSRFDDPTPLLPVEPDPLLTGKLRVAGEPEHLKLHRALVQRGGRGTGCPA
jgi:hypothetical protein